MPERRYALLIGNQTYPAPSDFTALNCPHADVDAMQEVLADQHRGDFHDIEVLKDADRGATMKAIGSALKQKDRDDLLLIYFSGHGQTDDHGDLYLATNNSEKDHLQATAIDARQLSQMMGRADAGKTVLILDCCHAGAFPTGFKSGNGLQATADTYARGGGCYVLMACGEFELARDGDAGGLSLLTGHLVEGLKGKADVNADGKITVKELSEYLDRALAVGGTQSFKQSGRNQQGDVLLSSSGIDPLGNALHEAEKQVIDWCNDGSVSRTVRNEVLAFIASDPDPSDPDRAAHLDAIRGVAEGSLRAGDFSERWVRATTGATIIADSAATVKKQARPAKPPPRKTPPPPPEPDPEPARPEAEPAKGGEVEPAPPSPRIDPPPYKPSWWSDLSFNLRYSEFGDWLVTAAILALCVLATAGLTILIDNIWPLWLWFSWMPEMGMAIALLLVIVSFFVALVWGFFDDDYLDFGDVFFVTLPRMLFLIPGAIVLLWLFGSAQFDLLLMWFDAIWYGV